ncbi:MAG: succinate dehydrogenase, hydrophobic membrane anchor protein [Gammaproteobacteria bacterium]|nr:succinate dehydrogenase, hydrophobic membrane anchor protein [Gammaproteobacteria bacterium]
MSSGFSGMNAWLIQRITGMYVGFFALILFGIFSTTPPQSYSEWVAVFASPLLQIGCSLFVLAILFHAWIGMRDIVLDYVHPLGFKIGFLTLSLIVLFGSGLWALRALYLVELA